MTTSHEAQFLLGVSYHTLDSEQRIDTTAILIGASLKSVELWEPAFGNSEGHLQEARCALAMAGVEPPQDVARPANGRIVLALPRVEVVPARWVALGRNPEEQAAPLAAAPSGCSTDRIHRVVP